MRTIRNTRTGEVRQVPEQELGNYRIAQPMVQPTAQMPQSQNLLAMLLPLLGGLGGGVVGALGGPAGVIAGSAIGSGLGETARQGMIGQKLQAGKILGETALGGLGAGLGTLIKGGRAVKTVAGLADEALDAGNIAQRTGKALRTGSYSNTATKVLKGKNIAPRAKEIAETTAKFKGSGYSKLSQLADDRKVLTESLQKLTTGKGAQAIPVVGDDLLTSIASEVSRTIDVTSGIGKTNLSFWGNKISKVKNVEELGDINRELLTSIQTASGEKKKALLSIQKIVGDELKGKVPATQSIFDSLSKLNAAEPVVQKAAGATWTVPFSNIQVSTSGAQALKDKVGSGLVKAGNVAAKSPISGSQFLGQSIAQGVGGLAGGGTPEGYVGQGGQPLATEQYSAEEPSGLKITKEQVAMARLLLPDKQADQIEAAYKLLNEGGDESATEAQVARKSAIQLTGLALQTLQANPNIKTGMIGGPLEQLKSKFGAGDQASLEFNALISNLTATIAKARAGTSFTPNEEKLLKQYSPAVGDSRQQLLVKLSVLQSVFGK